MPRKDPQARKEYAAMYAEKNAEKMRLYYAEYRRKNKELLAEKRKAIALERQEYARNYRKTCKDKVYKTKKKYVESKRGYVNAYAASRRSDKILRTPAWLSEFDILKIKCIYQMAAMYSKVNCEKYEVDHVIPLRGKLVSGLHVPSNLQIIMASENRLKHNKFEVGHA